MLEHVLRFSVQRRWLVLLCTIAVAIAGVFSLRDLPIDVTPDITNNQVQINTLYPALSPIEIEKQITFPIETALAGIPGLHSTRSLSRNGFSQVTAIFEDRVDLYFARQQVLERLNQARESMPPGAEPQMGAITTGLGEIYVWIVEFAPQQGEGSAAEDGRPGWQRDGAYLTPEGRKLRTELELTAYLREVQDWIIRPQLKNVPGVAGIDAIGGYVKQYHVQPDPMKLVSYGLTFHQIVEALEKNNASAGAGYIEHQGESYLVRAAGRIQNVEQIGEIVVGQREGTPIRVRDVADVGIGRELRTGSASENGVEVVVGTAMMLIGANSRQVAGDVDARIAEVNRTLPPGIRTRTVLNRTQLVGATIDTVTKNLAEGALLVIVVLFLLLGNIRAACITAMAIPLSMLITAMGMVQGKISGNLMSLGAIDFGLIVDGAVIISENCLRRLADRQHQLGRTLTLGERLETVHDAAREVRGATAFGEAIIITVYIPILALTGVEGRMFHPMAITVILALAAAFVLSLTFIPAMLAIALGGRIRERENILIRGAKWAYAPTLRWAIRLRYVTVGAGVATFALSLLLFMRLGQEVVPTLDEKNIAVQAIRIPSTSLTQSTRMQFEVERAISGFPEVALVYSKTGTAEMAADPMPPSISDTFVILKPQRQWPDPRQTKAQLQSRMEAALASLPGNSYEWTQPIQMRFNELIAGIRSDVAVKLYGDEFDKLAPVAEAIARLLADIPGAADVKAEQTEGLPVMNVEIDRAIIARYGLSVVDVQDVVAAAIGGREAGLVFEGDRRFDLVVRLPDDLRHDIPGLRNLPIPLPRHDDDPPASQTLAQRLASGLADGATRTGYIPLGDVARIDISEGLNQISRENGKRRVVIQANVRGRDIGSFVAQARQTLARDIVLPPGYWIDWGGQFENLLSARQRLLFVTPVCFALIFLLLLGTFHSIKHALVVFTAVPLALTGGIVALWLRDMPFSISAGVGFIALSGVAVLNGLVMITFINQLRREGTPLEEAIERGALTRLRPVLMTALVASLGFVPMALATGTGAEVQRPLATVVIGGVISSTVLTLVVLPALYRLWYRRDSVETSSNQDAVNVAAGSAS
ncbi:MAG: CusA/CzcA family heavy metal efflux RND transporter [Phycisphaeraceae bacterium]|nr:CusA/CzcA family heavy metal efflux RND transporter [Phycisphaeraceae bacterium]